MGKISCFKNFDRVMELGVVLSLFKGVARMPGYEARGAQEPQCTQCT